jgi:hypothetical protein
MLLAPALASAQLTSANSSLSRGGSIGGNSLGGSSLSGGGIGGSSLSGGGGIAGSFIGNSSNSFIGNSMSGSSLLGSTTTGTTGRGGATTPGATAPWGSFYTNPLAAGFTTATNPVVTSSRFGTALFNVSPTVAAAYAASTRAGTGVIIGPSTATQYNGMGQGYAGRKPTFYTVSSVVVGSAEGDFPAPRRPAPGELRGEMQALLANTPRFAGVRASMDGDTVVLTGRVRSDLDRRLAETTVRTTPFIRAVRNEIVVAPPP